MPNTGLLTNPLWLLINHGKYDNFFFIILKKIEGQIN